MEADRRVQELVDKLLLKDMTNNAYDSLDDKEKTVEKDHIVGLDDIKISNLLKDPLDNVSTPTSITVNNQLHGSSHGLSSSQGRYYDQLNQDSRDVEVLLITVPYILHLGM